MGIITVDGPQPGRYIIIFPAVACFIGIGILTFLNRIKSFKKGNNYDWLFTATLAAILVFTSSSSYIKHETRDIWAMDFNTQIATYTGRYLSKASGDSKIYFVGDETMYYSAIPTLPFLTMKNGIDIYSSVTSEIRSKDRKSHDYFIIIPSREAELETLKSLFPNGKPASFYNPRGDFLCWIFET